MLIDFRKLAKRLAETIHTINYWPEIKFNSLDKEKLKVLDGVTLVNDHSIQLKIEGGNHTILPCQYILYAIYVKQLALSVKAYIELFEQKKTQQSQNQIGESIINKTLSYSDFEIDDYSKIIGPKIFFDPSLNLGAKEIVNGSEGNYKIRGIVDFFGSVILKPINIPNASSSILGRFIYNLCENKEVYDYLEIRFQKNLPFIIKDSVIKDFCYHTMSFLYSYDQLNKIKGLIIKNNDFKFSSLKNNEISLTSIFRTSKHLLNSEELSQGGGLRFFEEPLFFMNNEYYYFSTEWTNIGTGRLDLKQFIALINQYYSEFKIHEKDNIFTLESSKEKTNQHSLNAKNVIYYGAPGTGKSHKVDKIIEELETKYYERVTFHPEYDNASFIGGYKPISVKIRYEDENGEYFQNEVHYKFVPQAFTNIYERAWQDLDDQYYLVIEEINRGNCAEIFGEIFQLLDRNSKYTVSPTKELKEYLISEAFKDEKHLGIVEGLKLPPNLSILATMNTSDQSLFPMDSAFKRRWDWEYIPICYTPIDDFKRKNDSFDFEIDIEDGKKYSWIKFIERINLNYIKVNPSLGMDKCIGNYFIKPDNGKIISLRPFINKVIFYLWNDVFKDEDNNVFEKSTSYEDFFPIETNGKKKIKELFDRINLKAISSLEIVEDESQSRQAAESTEETES